MRKSSLGKRGTSGLPVRKPSLTTMPETDGGANKGNCVKSFIPLPSRPRSSSTDRNSAAVNWPGITLSTPQMTTPMHAGLCASVNRYKGLRETASKSVKDMRPLSDKNFQMLAIQNIYNYFKENNVIDINTVPKTLSACSFTLKSFVAMSNHLFSRIFKGEEITMNNYTERIPVLARDLGYPNTVQKSWLVTANSSHSVPRVIGLLSWMVDLVQSISDCTHDIMFPHTEQDMEKNFEDDSDGSNVITSERFLQYYLSCFDKFNNDQDHNIEEKQIKQEAMDKLKVNDNNFKILHNTLSKLENHLSKEEVVREVKENKEVEDAKAKLLNEFCINEKSLQQKVAYLNGQNQKVEELRCKIAKVESTKERLAKNLSQISEHLTKQRFTPEDIVFKEKKCSELDEDIKLEKNSIDKWSKENFALDLEMARARSKFNEISNDYTTLIIKNVDMFPELQDLKVQVNLLKQDATTELQDMASCRVSLIKKLKIEVQEEETINDEKNEVCHAAKQMVQVFSDKLYQLNVNIEDLKQKLTVLNDNFKRLKQNEAETLRKLQVQLAELKVGMSDSAPLDKRIQELVEADHISTEHEKSMQEKADITMEEMHAIYQEYGLKIEEQDKRYSKYY